MGEPRGFGRHSAVILAGGRGTRLSPYTTILPKPLLPIGDRAILEIVVGQLRRAGFRDLHLAVGHLNHLIRAVFGDGQRHGVRLSYHVEPAPLGTAGPLTQIEGLDETFLMMNGDVLTTLDYGRLFRAHRVSGNLLTIASHRRTVATEFGILQVGDRHGFGGLLAVSGYDEKPALRYLVSTGVYIVEPEAVAYIPRDRPSDVPDLVLRLIDAGEPVGSYVHDGFWLDIGRPDDFQLANREYERLRPELFGEGGDVDDAGLRVFVCDGPGDGRRALFDEEPGVAVAGASDNGAMALRAIAQDPPDVVVVDLGMSGLDEWEAIGRIAEVAPGAGVVALSREPLDPRLGSVGERPAVIVLPLDAPGDAVLRAVHSVANEREHART
jgi:NDP-sugar pyrophosphorylase family protein